MKNGRCRFHGGKSTGPRTKAGKAASARRSTTHGLYAKGILPGEEEDLAQLGITADDLTDEINIAKLQLRRAWQVSSELLGKDPNDALELIETKTLSVQGMEEVDRRRAEVLRRRPDLWQIIDRCLRTVFRGMEARARVLEVRDGKLVRNEITGKDGQVLGLNLVIQRQDDGAADADAASEAG